MIEQFPVNRLCVPFWSQRFDATKNRNIDTVSPHFLKFIAVIHILHYCNCFKTYIRYVEAMGSRHTIQHLTCLVDI